jgi:SAM-dependent methyltransferase
MSSCPVCDSGAEAAFLAKVDLAYGVDHDLVGCPACGVIRFDPLPSAEQLERFYAAPYYDFDRSREEGKGMAFAGRLTRWRRTGRFLDVGCATGFFINGIREHSEWEVHGVDFGGSAVRYAREQLGLEVRHGELTRAGYADGFFDYIHVNNVLEHVVDPVAMLRECRRIVRPDGRVYLSVPNGANDSRELIDYYKEERRPAHSHKGHLFFFPGDTLVAMFERSGFDAIQKKSYGHKRGLRNLGKLPRKKNWKDAYRPPTVPGPRPDAGEIVIAGGKKRPSWYYRYRFFESGLRMLPGLHGTALDFMFLLQPR